MKCTLVSIDLAKSNFQICGFDEDRKVRVNKKVKRSNLIYELLKIDSTNIVIEVCYSSNPWGRRIERLGYKVFLIPAFVVSRSSELPVNPYPSLLKLDLLQHGISTPGALQNSGIESRGREAE